MTLLELIEKVKEHNLSKEDLEAYRDQLSGLYAQMQMEMAELEKEEAIFMGGYLQALSVSARKTQWKHSTNGQRLIVLKRYCLATKEMLNSLKSRLYSLYI